ncbi:hypothetical protein [Acaryochloris thomasi]|nr:hypothetical protein [Acaryochloris thomasi]
MRRKIPLMDKAIASLSLLGVVLILVAAYRNFLINGTLATIGFPSLMMVGVFFTLPTVELYRYRQIKPLGMSFRAVMVLIADRLFSGDQQFASIYWEIAAVAIALLFVFYFPRLWGMVARKVY